jgi:hypothetical protein
MIQVRDVRYRLVCNSLCCTCTYRPRYRLHLFFSLYHGQFGTLNYDSLTRTRHRFTTRHHIVSPYPYLPLVYSLSPSERSLELSSFLIEYCTGSHRIFWYSDKIGEPVCMCSMEIASSLYLTGRLHSSKKNGDLEVV